MRSGVITSQADHETIHNNYRPESAGTARRFFVCGTCLKLRDSEDSGLGILSAFKDHCGIARDSYRLVKV